MVEEEEEPLQELPSLLPLLNLHPLMILIELNVLMFDRYSTHTIRSDVSKLSTFNYFIFSE